MVVAPLHIRALSGLAAINPSRSLAVLHPAVDHSLQIILRDIRDIAQLRRGCSVRIAVREADPLYPPFHGAFDGQRSSRAGTAGRYSGRKSVYVRSVDAMDLSAFSMLEGL